MRKSIFFAAILNVPLAGVALAADGAPPITREILPSADILGGPRVDRVEVQKIGLGANVKPGAHIHSVPVIGYVIEGTITFQVDKQPERVLKAGDAFFEPANTVISHFDAGNQPAKFIAYYLLGKDEKNELKMVP